jgi:glycerol uptake facilitator-like aquaporin
MAVALGRIASEFSAICVFPNLTGVGGSQYWLWCPIIAPICGAIVAVAFYDVFLFLGCESVVNRPYVYLF